MRVPTKDEINVYNSPDEITACEHFGDKSLEEAEMLFRDASLHYCQDLMWMGPKAFAFYLQAAIAYLQSEDSSADSDMINCLQSVVQYRATQEEFSLALNAVNRIIDYVIANYNKFAVDPSIYGDLLATYQGLKAEVGNTRQ